MCLQGQKEKTKTVTHWKEMNKMLFVMNKMLFVRDFTIYVCMNLYILWQVSITFYFVNLIIH